jgi:hypothetical protein
MGIRRRGDEWLVTVELGTDELDVRRRAHATAESEDEAKRIEAKLKHDVYEGNHLKPSHETVASFCTRYLQDHSSSIAPSTRARYATYIRAHIEPDLGRVPLARFTPKVAARWKADLLSSGLSPSTVRKHLVFVSAAMKLAVAPDDAPAVGWRHAEGCNCTLCREGNGRPANEESPRLNGWTLDVS